MRPGLSLGPGMREDVGVLYDLQCRPEGVGDEVGVSARYHKDEQALVQLPNAVHGHP